MSGSEPHVLEDPDSGGTEVMIDRLVYLVRATRMTGAEVRNLVHPPIDDDADLYQSVADGLDRRIGSTEEVAIVPGLRFFTAPSRILAG